MNAVDVLKYGHLTLLQALDSLPEAEWETPDVCGIWSVKEIMAHLSSYELALVEILTALGHGQTEPPLLAAAMIMDPQAFNDEQVTQRQDQSPGAVLAEYNEAYGQVMALAARLPAATFSQNGLLPWYGADYDLDDFLTYTYYGHKREHSAQINVFGNRLG
jgi:hypothetical protein